MRRELYDRITGTKNVFERVLEGIEEAKRVELYPLKINCVVTRACNEGEILDFARMAHDGNIIVRFIEYMPFDGTKFWDKARAVSGREIIDKISFAYKLAQLEKEHGQPQQITLSPMVPRVKLVP